MDPFLKWTAIVPLSETHKVRLQVLWQVRRRKMERRRISRWSLLCRARIHSGNNSVGRIIRQAGSFCLINRYTVYSNSMQVVASVPARLTFHLPEIGWHRAKVRRDYIEGWPGTEAMQVVQCPINISTLTYHFTVYLARECLWIQLVLVIFGSCYCHYSVQLSIYTLSKAYYQGKT